MYTHVCRVNALSPRHAGVGGLALPRHNKADPFLTLGLQQEGIYKSMSSSFSNTSRKILPVLSIQHLLWTVCGDIRGREV